MISTTTFSGKVTTTCVVASPGSEAAPLLLMGQGTARCKPDDAYSDLIGEGIATGRAIADFGRQVTEVWEARSRTQAEMVGYVCTVYPGRVDKCPVCNRAIKSGEKATG